MYISVFTHIEIQLRLVDRFERETEELGNGLLF